MKNVFVTAASVLDVLKLILRNSLCKINGVIAAWRLQRFLNSVQDLFSMLLAYKQSAAFKHMTLSAVWQGVIFCQLLPDVNHVAPLRFPFFYCRGS